MEKRAAYTTGSTAVSDGGKEPPGREGLHLRSLALSRFFRLIRRMHDDGCPVVNERCYWCGKPMTLYTVGDAQGRYVADRREYHASECPWVTVLDYSALHDDPPREPARPDRDDPGR